MPVVLRTNRVASDSDILRFNACGLSLRTVGRLTNVHPTSVAARLRLLKAPPADTRRAFMEDVFAALSHAEQEWLCDQLNQNLSVKQYVTQLLRQEYAKQQYAGQHPALVQRSETEPDQE